MIEYYLENCNKFEFDRLANCDETYFCNGILFENDTDNLVAFPVYSDSTDKPETYFKIMRRVKNV